jgi:hypothetical protein
MSHVESSPVAQVTFRSFPRAALGYVVVGLLGLVVGYFAGREHLKYEMRSAIQSAASEMQKGLASAFGANPISGPSKSKEEAPPSKPKEPEPVSVTLIKKGYLPHDYERGNYQDAITFAVSFKNLTGKDIRAFEGVIDFTDLLDNTILSSHLAINDPIGAGAAMEWKGQLAYNQFMSSHQRLRGEERSNLKIVFTPKKVLFVDGTTKEFE